MNKNILEIRNLSKKIGNQEILSNISINIEKNKVYGLLGPNGAGKSSLLKIISGIWAYSRGQILFEGKEGKDFNINIGAMIEGPSVYPNLSAYDNLYSQAIVLGINKERIYELLDIVGLSNVGNKLVKNYSLGMKQRLSIAMALLNNPKILILDEPANGLDPMGIQELRNLIKTFTKNKITVIVSSHILSEINHISDNIGIISKGKLIYEGKNPSSPEELENLFMQKIKEVGGELYV